MSSITTTDVMNCANLSRLAISDQTANAYADNLQKILKMMDILSQVDTDNIKPLANIHEACQPLRNDIADTKIDRDAYQAVAPQTQDGLYLVPQVIE